MTKQIYAWSVIGAYALGVLTSILICLAGQ